MRVLFVIRSLGRGGAERQLAELSKGLAARGHAVHVVTFHPDHALAQGFQSAGVTKTCLSRGGRWDLAGLARGLLREAREFRPDAVHAYMDVPNVLTALVRPRLGRASLLWGFRASNMDLPRYGVLPRVLFQAERALSRLPDAIVVNSEAGRAHRIRHGIPAHRMVVIPNGVDADRFHPDPAAGQAVRAHLGIGPDAPLVGHVGRIDPMKDHANLVRAFARVAKAVPGARLLVAGTDPHGRRHEHVSLAEELGLRDRVHWLGPQEDLRGLYNALDVLASSSAFGEGFPNVVAEAMACGKPCVVTDVGDSRILADGHGGVVPPRDPAALANAISRILRMSPDQRKELGARSRRHVARNFGLDLMVKRTEALLVSVSPHPRDPNEGTA